MAPPPNVLIIYWSTSVPKLVLLSKMHNRFEYKPPHYMANSAAEIVSLVWGTPANVNGFRVLAALLHDTLVVGVSQTAALNRGSHLYSAGRPSRWALAHISSCLCCSTFLIIDERVLLLC